MEYRAEITTTPEDDKLIVVRFEQESGVMLRVTYLFQDSEFNDVKVLTPLSQIRDDTGEKVEIDPDTMHCIRRCATEKAAGSYGGW